MRRALFLSVTVAMFALFLSASAFEFTPAMSKAVDDLHWFSELVRRVPMLNRPTADPLDLPCLLCGIALNEVESLVMENRSMTDIQDALRKDICSRMEKTLEVACDALVETLPIWIGDVEKRWTVDGVCVDDLHFCPHPEDNYTDPVHLPTMTLNLDLAPEKRWNEICSVPFYQQNWQKMVSVLKQLFAGGEKVEDLGHYILTLMPDTYAAELSSCASSLGIDSGWLTLLNIGYEASDACTSIVAQDTDGHILHARNLDFWAGMGFTNTLKNVALIIDMQRGGKTVAHVTGFAGYMGVLSAQVPEQYSLTIDTRFYPQGPAELFEEIVIALEHKNASLVSFLARDVIEQGGDFASALNTLSNYPLVADVYYIVAGISAGQGAVISRNRNNASDVWMLDSAAGRWFEVETNYDHWKPAPWFDDRVDPANHMMNAIGQSAVTLPQMWEVLSTKPVFNIQTTYTILSNPATGYWDSWSRYCHYPCAE